MTPLVAPLDWLFPSVSFINLISDHSSRLGSCEKSDNPIVFHFNKLALDADLPFKRLFTIGIGDGGNEVGMGKIFEHIVTSPNIPNAAQIACTVSADFLIVASVSNWGGYALAAATAVVAVDLNAIISHKQSPTVNDNIKPKSKNSTEIMTCRREAIAICLPSGSEETQMCRRMVLEGARDGITGKGRSGIKLHNQALNTHTIVGSAGSCEVAKENLNSGGEQKHEDEEDSDDYMCELWVDGMPLEQSLEVLQDIKDIACCPRI